MTIKNCINVDVNMCVHECGLSVDVSSDGSSDTVVMCCASGGRDEVIGEEEFRQGTDAQH